MTFDYFVPKQLAVKLLQRNVCGQLFLLLFCRTQKLIIWTSSSATWVFVWFLWYDMPLLRNEISCCLLKVKKIGCEYFMNKGQDLLYLCSSFLSILGRYWLRCCIFFCIHTLNYLKAGLLVSLLSNAMTGLGLFQPLWALSSSACSMNRKATASTVASSKQR